MNNTTLDEVKDKFFSLITTGEVLPDALVDEWLDSAIGEYELELHQKLDIVEEVVPEMIDDELQYVVIKKFTSRLSSAQKSLLGRYMQREFITRELSRWSKVTGIDSKDERVSGLQATKITLRAELDKAETAIAELVFKLKELS